MTKKKQLNANRRDIRKISFFRGTWDMIKKLAEEDKVTPEKYIETFVRVHALLRASAVKSAPKNQSKNEKSMGYIGVTSAAAPTAKKGIKK